jgi:N-acyl-D-aspartate/D-glutamate deacylase
VAADIYLYTAGGTGLDSVIPSWAHEGGREKLLERLKDPQIRARLKGEIKTGAPGWWNIVEAAGGWDNIVLAYAANTDNARFEGKNLTEIAKEWNKEPADAAFDLVAEGTGGRVSAIYHMMSERDVETALKFPWTSIGSDASAALDPNATGPAHPRAHGNFPRLIAVYVRERKILTLEEAVRKMTSWAATRMRIPNRGTIKEGNWADVTIFDYDKIQDRATYQEPRLAPVGIEYVLVNGQIVMENGVHTGARPGKIIYGQGYQK